MLIGFMPILYKCWHLMVDVEVERVELYAGFNRKSSSIISR